MSENKNTLNVSSATSGIPDMKVNSNNTDVTYSNPQISYDSSNNKSDGMIGNMPVNINKDVPTPNSDAQNITSLIKHSGEVTGYILEDGTRLSKDEGVTLAKSGGINGVAVGVSKKGEEYLRSLPDQNENNNLSSLPTVNE
ncbi:MULTISPECIES: DUF3892 domain-containing protein [Clostridium]|uniref:DUF3892 domain-containing protein n=1 Tax=Clostridium TaxID=1485 RepID=UPI0005FB1618|nr:hypothetical protein ClosIBUN125C_CONTIG16g00974 [Clostridium sp. IBUN125C]KJZ89127.1 hypothetical protein ClosIBUN22A_CONTIG3g00061 [Clostridium sp. IBUN22A]KJZ94870.1 hypothetical protein ClosIBUN13A_CONTIG183g02902 [Clostridium sp. IBUN13A]KJZ95044.1 hypothetical protein ClosIBUN62F_CONTIG2g00063 [Clostridium sp. IBUN62F]